MMLSERSEIPKALQCMIPIHMKYLELKIYEIENSKGKESALAAAV